MQLIFSRSLALPVTARRLAHRFYLLEQGISTLLFQHLTQQAAKQAHILAQWLILGVEEFINGICFHAPHLTGQGTSA